MKFFTKTLRILTVTGVACAVLASAAHAQEFREGLLATQRSDGDWSYAFSFVDCKGNLRLDFHDDKRLNKFRKKTADGGLFVKFNKNKYQMTFFPDGRAMKRDGTFTTWRYATSEELAGKLGTYLPLAKAKCR